MTQQIDGERQIKDASITPQKLATAVIPNDGWIPCSGSSWSYTSADSPTFVASVPDADAVLMSVGWRLKLTQTSVKYFIITAKGTPSAGYTPVTMYGGTDYTLVNAGITSPYFSPVKAPFGFPLDPDKWTVSLSDGSNVSQASPTASTWYNLGSLSLAIPIGKWRVYYELACQVTITLAGAANVGFQSTLSTANNSESDSGFTTTFTNALPVLAGAATRATVHREKFLLLASKTTYYLNGLTGATGATSLAFRGDVVATSVKCVCAYL